MMAPARGAASAHHIFFPLDATTRTRCLAAAALSDMLIFVAISPHARYDAVYCDAASYYICR
jgi:uncharacterized membrane protein YcjF (UPF0283 family)